MKKIVYIEAKTGKELKYGDYITYSDSGKFDSGYSYSTETTLPVINATIPDLIKDKVIIQKEVDTKDDASLDDRIDKLEEIVKELKYSVDGITKFLGFYD